MWIISHHLKVAIADVLAIEVWRRAGNADIWVARVAVSLCQDGAIGDQEHDDTECQDEVQRQFLHEFQQQ
jgi:hypothetical protein